MKKYNYYPLICCLLLFIACKEQKQLEDLSLDELESEISQLEEQLEKVQSIKNLKLEAAIANGESVPESIKASSKKKRVFEVSASDSTILIRGKIDMARSYKRIKIVRENSYAANFTQNLPISSEGSFSKEFKIPANGIYQISLGKNQFDIYLENGKTLGIVIDSTSQGLPQYVGDLAAENNYLVNKTDFGISRLHDEIFELSGDVFQSQMDSMQNQAVSNLNNIKLDEEQISTAFLELENENIKYCYQRNVLSYLNNQPDKKEKEKLKLDFMTSPDLSNLSLMSLHHYKKFLYEFVEFTGKQNAMRDLNIKQVDFSNAYSYYENRYDNLNKMTNSTELLNMLKTDLVSKAIKELKTIEVNPLYEKFLAEVENPTQKRIIKRTYKSNIPLTKGAYAPEILGITTTGDEVKLSDFNGKYVYIFVWATWCGPCKTEMPAYEHMVDQLGHKNVEFLGVSVDKNRKNWEESFIYNKYPGSQILVEGDWESPMIVDFKLQSVPQFIFIDPDGKIIALNAPAPTKGGGNFISAFGV
jgi:thiol-disulfide isomerase/thioredoxin